MAQGRQGARHGSARPAALKELGSCGPCFGSSVLPEEVSCGVTEILRPRVAPARDKGWTSRGLAGSASVALSYRRGYRLDRPTEVQRPLVALVHDVARAEPDERGSRPAGRDDSRVEADGAAEGHAAGRYRPAGERVRRRAWRRSCCRGPHAAGRAESRVGADAGESRVAIAGEAGAELGGRRGSGSPWLHLRPVRRSPGDRRRERVVRCGPGRHAAGRGERGVEAVADAERRWRSKRWPQGVLLWRGCGGAFGQESVPMCRGEC